MITYDDSSWLVWVALRYKGSVFPRAFSFALPSAILAIVFSALDDFSPDFRERLGMLQLSESLMWTALTVVTTILLSFRTNQAMGRFWEGTSLLHQMRGEWFDAVSCLVTFSRGAKASKPEQVDEFRQTLVRLFSLMHGSALQEIKANHNEAHACIDVVGLDPETLNHLRMCEDYKFNRVEVILHMIQVLVTQALDDGVLKIAPPILSRVYQTLSRGLVNLLNARKITDTLFPFPFAQLIVVLLYLHTLFAPLVMSAIIKAKVWSAICTFVTVFAFYSMNFIAIELEMPFGDDENDLPLDHFQAEMNRSILLLLHEKSDHLPHTSDKCTRVYEHLVGAARKTVTRRRQHQDLHKGHSGDSESHHHQALFDGDESEDGNDISHQSSVLSGMDRADLQAVPLVQAQKVQEAPQIIVESPQKVKAEGVLEAQKVTMESKPKTEQHEIPKLQLPLPLSEPKFTGLEPVLDKSLDDIASKFENWIQKADDQAKALSRNTEVILRFTETFPKLLASVERSRNYRNVPRESSMHPQVDLSHRTARGTGRHSRSRNRNGVSSCASEPEPDDYDDVGSMDPVR